MVLVTGTRLPDVYALSRRTASLRSDLAASHDHESLCVLTVGEGRPYSNREIEASLGIRVVSSSPGTRSTPRCTRSAQPRGGGSTSSSLARTAATTASTLSALVRDRRTRLAPAPSAGEREGHHG